MRRRLDAGLVVNTCLRQCDAETGSHCLARRWVANDAACCIAISNSCDVVCVICVVHSRWRLERVVSISNKALFTSRTSHALTCCFTSSSVVNWNSWISCVTIESMAWWFVPQPAIGNVFLLSCSHSKCWYRSARTSLQCIEPVLSSLWRAAMTHNSRRNFLLSFMSLRSAKIATQMSRTRSVYAYFARRSSARARALSAVYPSEHDRVE